VKARHINCSKGLPAKNGKRANRLHARHRVGETRSAVLL
jgi:hypothetical protein